MRKRMINTFETYCLACLLPLLMLAMTIFVHITGKYDDSTSLFIGYGVSTMMLVAFTIIHIGECSEGKAPRKYKVSKRFSEWK